MRQVLLNLLSNAIKFGRGAPIEVTSRGTEEGGVEIADLDRVFDEFVQLKHSGHRGGAEVGTGLGLPISKRLAALLDGELTAESELGAGSVFRLRLPRATGSGGGGGGSRDGAAATPDAPAPAASPTPPADAADAAVEHAPAASEPRRLNRVA